MLLTVEVMTVMKKLVVTEKVMMIAIWMKYKYICIYLATLGTLRHLANQLRVFSLLE